MSKRIAAALWIGLILSPALVNAGVENAGTTTANFLSIGMGARVLGMGGATLGLANGVAGAGWNAGALGWIDGTELALAHSGLAEGSNQEWLGAGGRLGRSGTSWGLSGLYQSEGSFQGLDASGASTGSFNVASMALGVQLAQRIGNVAAIGFGAKWVSDDLGSVRGSGVTFDGGLLIRGGPIGIGFAAQNAGGQMRYGGSAYDFPTSYGAGVSVENRRSGLRLDVDVNAPTDYYRNVRAGVEWQWKDRVALRGGYRKELNAPPDEALTGPSFGMGLGARGLSLDYGYLITQSGEGQHRLGLTFHPGKIDLTPDPFGQKQMPRDFDDRFVGPPAPTTNGPQTSIHGKN